MSIWDILDHIFALTFFFLAPASSGNNQLSYSGAGKLRAEQLKMLFGVLL